MLCTCVFPPVFFITIMQMLFHDLWKTSVKNIHVRTQKFSAHVNLQPFVDLRNRNLGNRNCGNRNCVNLLPRSHDLWKIHLSKLPLWIVLTVKYPCDFFVSCSHVWIIRISKVVPTTTFQPPPLPFNSTAAEHLWWNNSVMFWTKFIGNLRVFAAPSLGRADFL